MFEGLRNVNAAEHLFWGTIPNRSERAFMHKGLQHKIMAAVWQNFNKNDWKKSLNAFGTYNIEGLYV